MVTWLGKCKDIVIGIEGDTFHINHNPRNTVGGITGSHHELRTNALEAIACYATAVSQRIEHDLMKRIEAEGYSHKTGLKRTGGESMYGWICENCGAHLDPGERCDCEQNAKASATVQCSQPQSTQQQYPYTAKQH